MSNHHFLPPPLFLRYDHTGEQEDHRVLLADLRLLHPGTEARPPPIRHCLLAAANVRIPGRLLFLVNTAPVAVALASQALKNNLSPTSATVSEVVPVGLK